MDIDDLLLKYIKEGLRKGVPEERLKAYIRSKGYPPEVTQEVMNRAKKGISETKLALARKVNWKKYSIALIGIVLIIAVIAASYFIREQIKENTRIKDLKEICSSAMPFYDSCRAIAENDVNYCDNLEDEARKKICYDNYYLVYAMKNDDSSLCENIKFLKMDSLLCEPVVKGDNSVCETFEDENMKAYCIALVARDPELCSEIQDDPTNQFSRTSCFDYNYYLKANLMSEAAICDNISNDKKRTECTAFIKQDSSLCEIIDLDKCEEVT